MEEAVREDDGNISVFVFVQVSAVNIILLFYRKN